MPPTQSMQNMEAAAIVFEECASRVCKLKYKCTYNINKKDFQYIVRPVTFVFRFTSTGSLTVLAQLEYT